MRKPTTQSKKIRKFILGNVDAHSSDITAVTMKKFGVSRSAVLRHIRKLADDDHLIVSGTTRDRRYELKLLAELNVEFPIDPTLAEDKVWRNHVRPLLDGVPRNVLDICQYGFTEMLNNAIEHSEGTGISIGLERTPTLVKMTILDNGVGIFNKVKSELGLDDQLHVALELSKGKLTTDPERHTGEGIFFTSRTVDVFRILSGHLFFQHVKSGDDWLLEQDENKDLVRGTFVQLEISPRSESKLEQVFNDYTAAGDGYGFSRTHVPVALARYGDENLISRSQAKRLLARFDRFDQVFLDFQDVETIGQSFADEIFRVFARQNPHVQLDPINTNEQVKKMILRAQAAATEIKELSDCDHDLSVPKSCCCLC